MANSFVRYTGNGTTTTYAIPFSYRDTADLSATVAGVNITAYTLDAAGTNLTFTTAPANGSAIEIRRTTSQTTKLVDYVSGSVLTENDLDTDSDQAFFMSQEAIDDANDVISLDNADFQWDTQNKRLKNVADPTSAQDAATKNYLENTWLTPANKTALTTVNANIANINAVNSNEANINSVNSNETNINTVATNIGSVNTVATDISKVIAVANDLAEAVSEVETVADDLNEATSEIDTVAGAITNVNNVGNNIANVNTVAGISSDVTSVAGISSDIQAINNIKLAISNVSSISPAVSLVNGNSANINTVAGNNTNVSTVAGISGNVTTVAGISSDVTSVANDATDIGTVAGISSDVTSVAGISSIVSAVNSNSSNINAVNSNSSNINTVAGNNTNINTVAGISSDVTTVAGISSDVQAVENIASNVTTVAGMSTAINTTNSNSSNINTVAGSIANVNNVGGSIASVNSVATNLASVNSFANTYLGASSSAPTQDPDGSALDLGDLYFDTGSNQLKVYSSTGWVNAGSSVNGTSDRFKYTVSGTPTTISGNDDNSKSLSYDAGFIDVFLNGIKMVNGTDVTVTSGNSVVFASALTNGDVVDIITFGTFNIASMNASNLTSGTVPDARITGAYTGITNLTMSGDLVTGGNISTGNSGNLFILDSAGQKSGKIANSSSTSNSLKIDADPDNGGADTFMQFQIDGSEKMRINSSGNVGIGTSSPGTIPLHVVATDGGNVDELLQIRNNSTTAGTGGRIRFVNSTDGTSTTNSVSISSLRNSAGDQDLLFETVDSERMRIDSSGNVLINTTDASTLTAGIKLRASDNAIAAVVTSNPSGYFGRLSTDGDIIKLRKDSTTVGVIGTQNWGIGTSSPASELEIESATPEIRIDATSGAGRNYKIHSDGNELYIEGIGSSGSLKIGEDGTYGVSIDLGTGGIQASDGIYLGGTGTANKLDDYEEGTFTPTYTDGFSSVTYTAQSGYYTKIGDFVFVRIRLENSAATTNGNRIEIGSLPFTTHGSNPGSGFNWSYAPAGVTGSSTTNLPIMYVPSGSSLIKWYNTAGGNFVGGDLNSTVLDIYINGSYQTT